MADEGQQEAQQPQEEEQIPAASLLSEAVVNECKEYFTLFDHEGNDSILTRDLGNVMRAMGQHPKEAEVEAIIADIDYENTGVIDFQKFLRIMAKRFKETEDDDEIREALKVLDKSGTGTMSAKDLRDMLTTLGEKLNDEEIEECIREADRDGDGMINIEEFAQILLE